MYSRYWKHSRSTAEAQRGRSTVQAGFPGFAANQVSNFRHKIRPILNPHGSPFIINFKYANSDDRAAVPSRDCHLTSSSFPGASFRTFGQDVQGTAVKSVVFWSGKLIKCDYNNLCMS